MTGPGAVPRPGPAAGAASGDDPARVFAALMLEPELAERVAARVDRALAGDPGFRRPRPAGLHLTLHFLGDVPRAALPGLGAALELLQGLPAPLLRLTGSGCFPDPERPRVLWIGVGEEPGGEGRLERLARAAREALGAGRAPATPYRPHVTVARPRDPRGGLPPAFGDLGLDEPWRPLAVDLLESVRGEGPARYASRARVVLATGEPPANP